MKIKRKTLIFFLILITFYFAFKSLFLTFPLHNDEINHMRGMKEIVANGFFPFVEWWGYHPPLIYELSGIIVSSFFQNNSILGVRLIIAFFGFLVLFFTYLLGKKIFDVYTAKVAVILLFFLPIFQAQTSLFHLAIPFTFLFLATYYFYLEEKYYYYFIFASFLVLTKEPGLLIIFLIAVFDFILKEKNNFKLALKRVIFLSLPQSFFLGWILLNKKHLGWYLYPYHFNFFTKNKPDFAVVSFLSVLKTNFLFSGTWILSAIIVSGFILLLFSKKVKLRECFRNEIIFEIFLTIFFLIFFSYGTFLPRYMLFTFPLLCLIAAKILTVFKNIRFFFMVIFSTTVIIFILNWFYLSEKKISWAGEMNYAYLNIVRNHREVIEFTNTNFPLERVISHYPLNSAFFYPSAGYVNERQRRIIEDLDLQSFSVFKGVLIVSDFFVKEDKWEKIRNSKKLRLVREVKNRGIKTEIYKVY